MDPNKDEQTEILRNIWQEMKSLGSSLGGRIDETNARLDKLNTRVDGLNTGVDGLNTRVDDTNTRLETMGVDLSRAIVESEVRTATAIADMAGAIRSVRDLLEDRLDLRDRVERCERDIEVLKRKAGP